MKTRTALRDLDDVASLAVSWPVRPALEPLRKAVDFGNGVPAWLAVSAALGAHGQRLRRAAAEGAAALVAGSAVSNLLAKQLNDRRRPLPIRLRGTHKDSTSWPSSHTVSGAAYCTAAGLADRRSLALTLPVLATVAACRVYGRQHHIGDVAGGAPLR